VSYEVATRAALTVRATFDPRHRLFDFLELRACALLEFATVRLLGELMDNGTLAMLRFCFGSIGQGQK
jgi:hypothetical protein